MFWKKSVDLDSLFLFTNESWQDCHMSVLRLIWLDEWPNFYRLIAGWQCPTPQEDHLYVAEDGLHAYSGKLLGIY